jgi:hypothetical protein
MANYCILWAGKLEIFGIGVACQNSHGVGWGLCVVSCNAHVPIPSISRFSYNTTLTYAYCV